MKEDSIRLRITTKEKNDWDQFAKSHKFPSISQMIRYIVSEFIESATKPKENNKQKQLLETNQLIETLTLERNEYMQKINDILGEMRKSKDMTIDYTIKGQILKLLEKHRYKSEDISSIFNKPEHEILVILNDLTEKNMIRLTKTMEYEVINGNNK